MAAGLRGCAGPGGKGRRMRVVGVWGPPGRGGLSLMGVSGGRFRWGSLSGAFLFGGGGGLRGRGSLCVGGVFVCGSRWVHVGRVLGERCVSFWGEVGG